jgi:flagellar biosynthesis/type III secretory pathway M-ring protein FliF/YscJ
MKEQTHFSFQFGMLVFKALVIVCLLLFVGKPVMKMLSETEDFKIELSEEESEKDLEEKEESKLDEMDNFFDSYLNNSLAAANKTSKTYFQQLHDYTGFQKQVQVPPPELS